MAAIDDVTKQMSELTVISFRQLDEIKRLARHFRNVINHPDTSNKPIVLNYLKSLEQTHKRIYSQKRDGVEVEFIFTTEKKSSVQRQRFNSLPISEVPELLKAELSSLSNENAQQVHICTDCDVEIELNDEIPLMESLQKHFNLEIHLPKLKRESIDVAEPIVLPNMSRRMSAMECGELPVIEQRFEKLERGFSAKLETQLIRHLPDNSEASIDAAVKFYQASYDKLCTDVGTVDFAALTSSVAPIIMSIKDNVNQNFAADANKNYENDENDTDKPNKNQPKKYRFYGPIENYILKLLSTHKLLSLTDDRTGKPAFFCMACEYYTLRFRYDSVLNHVFSDTHVHNLSCIIQADTHIPFVVEERTVEKIKELNAKFLTSHSINGQDGVYNCALCKISLETLETAVLHVLEENHLAKMSDKLYRKAKSDANSEEWGPKSLDWAKFLAGTGKPLTNKDHVVIENFIKPSGKIANFCSCCDMTLKGPRQVLFNHIRQKKHLRNAAPHKLSLLFKNYCRPAEYFASFGNFYACTICPEYVAVPSFAAIVAHFESDSHLESIAKLIRAALYPSEIDLPEHKINLNEFKCEICDSKFEDRMETVQHILSNVQHQNVVMESKMLSRKGDIISVYMNGHYILHTEGAMFTCTCKGVFNSLRALLTHLVYADHFESKPSSEIVFRFYLELKHNINLLVRNKYVYYDFGKLKCGVCDSDVEDNENAKRHVMSPRHRESMGASYVNLENVE